MSLCVSTDNSSSFCWDDYLVKTNGRPAKSECFKQSLIPPVNKFEVNTLLEAEDQRSAALDIQSPLTFSNDLNKSRHSSFSSNLGDPLGVAGTTTRRSTLSFPSGSVRRFRAAAFSLARVVETWGPRLKVRLVGTDDRNDYWFLVDSDQIRPYPSGNPLQPPFGYMHNHLVWNRTLKKATEGAIFADPTWFIKPPLDPEDNYFQLNDKLEAVDRRNTQLICPASIGAINGQHVLISFDGWSGTFDYWARFDSRELFPVGWCKLANYPLQAPGPNAVRSPSSHSTPALPAIPSSNSNLPSVSRLPSKVNSNPSRLIQERKRTNRSRRRTLFTTKRRSKSHSHANKVSLYEHCEVKTPYPNIHNASRRVEQRNSYPPALSKTTAINSWTDLNKNCSHLVPDRSNESLLRAASTSQLPPNIQTESADSSMQSLSSPPTIHPVLEDVNDSLNNLSSSPSDHPPRIEAAVSLSDSIPKRHRRTSSSSDCVVRLQVKTSLSPSESLQPELKSWQVVTEPRLKLKKPKSAKHHKYSEKDFSGLKKKLKLVNGNLTNYMKSSSEHVTNDENLISNITDIGSDMESVHHKPSNMSNSNQLNNFKSDTATYEINELSDYNVNRSHSNKSDVIETNGTNFFTNPILRTNNNEYHANPYYFDEIHSSANRENLSIETTDPSGPGWISGKLDALSNKAMDPLCASHQNVIDYLDNQSLTTHLPSSTVSPSSLDLGPCPLPNPAQWTIDDVYHYITTRDSNLAEAAEKFKEHEIDGQALLLLSMESLRNYMKIKLGPALKVDHLINRLKRGLM